MADKKSAAAAAGGRKENIHAGHRERLKGQVAERGFRGMPDHLVLEYLLFYAIPQKDTNPLAHALIKRFGSLVGVFDADIEDLKRVDGVGPAVAQYLKNYQAINELYALEKMKGHNKDLTIDDIGAFLVRYFLNKTEEEVFAFFFDNSGGIIASETVYKGTINSTFVSPRILAEAAFRYKAVSVILAHNHPSGEAESSEEDVRLTHHLMNCFDPFDISIRAHLIVAKDRYTDILPSIYKNFDELKPRYIAVRSSSGELRASTEDFSIHGDLDGLYEKYGLKQ